MNGVMNVSMWVVCGVLAAGIHNHNIRTHFGQLHQSQRQATSTFLVSLLLGTMGPVSLILVPTVHGVTGIMPPNIGWTLEWRAIPCTEVDQISRKVWCGERGDVNT